ncbi:recombinase-like helix-turn-helix domain-containing protein [Tomitella biformata]|uniref:recombinase-like helix-turn-helix domain-containing protein n=1 Tax=Tomitella biformata TaxID=630403 RepID=UPI000465375B|nr:recombinase-like helix-turn-helix domain-containing protein [Tomitella biformata]
MTLYLQEIQTRTAPPTPYEEKLAGAIEEVFGTGVHDLEGVVSGLNGMGMHSPAGEPWDADSFTTEIHRMGA